MTTLNHYFILTLGDPSLDGHGKNAEYTVLCSHPTKKVKTAYQKAVKKLGFDITQECEEYEDSSLSYETREAIKTHFPKLMKSIDPDYIMEDDFVNIYLQMVKFGDPTIVCKIRKTPDKDFIDIGGYGLFV